MFLAPAFLKDGDLNHDSRFSQEEFQALGEKWFSAWDTNKSGKLDLDKIKAGLNTLLGPGPGFGPPGRFGPGNREPGLGLQGAEGKRNGLASAMGIEFTYVHADLDFEGQTFNDVAVRYKGNGTFMESRNSLKRSLKVDLNKFVKGQKLAGITKLNLHNNVTDASWMNEVLAYRLYRDAGVPAPRTAYARVFVTVPGKFDRQYFGLYSLVEDVDRAFVEQRFGTKRGAIFKPVTPRLFADLGDDWSKYKQTYDPKTPLFEEQIQQMIQFCRLVSSANEQSFAAKVGEFVDLEEFARFMAVMVFLSDLDGILGPGQNLYLYLPPKAQWLEFIPWDQDHSWGQFPMRGTQQQREQLSLFRPWEGENPFLERMYRLERFKALYRARLEEFSHTLFRPERFQQQVDELAAVIRPAVAEESAEKLTRFDSVVAGNPIQPGPFGGGFGSPRRDPFPGNLPREVPAQSQGGRAWAGPPFGGFGDPVKPIKSYVRIRAQSVADQLAGKSHGLMLAGSGFGGRGPGGGPGPGNFGPATMLAPAWMRALDAENKGEIDRAGFVRGFSRWFDSWNTDRSGVLTEEQLRAGINQDLTPFRGGPP